MSDKHYRIGDEIAYYAPTCKRCGRKFRGREGAKYGSNACRQMAYRARSAASRYTSDPKCNDLVKQLQHDAAGIKRRIRMAKGGAA